MVLTVCKNNLAGVCLGQWERCCLLGTSESGRNDPRLVEIRRMLRRGKRRERRRRGMKERGMEEREMEEREMLERGREERGKKRGKERDGGKREGRKRRLGESDEMLQKLK